LRKNSFLICKKGSIVKMLPFFIWFIVWADLQINYSINQQPSGIWLFASFYCKYSSSVLKKRAIIICN